MDDGATPLPAWPRPRAVISIYGALNKSGYWLLTGALFYLILKQPDVMIAAMSISFYRESEMFTLPTIT